MFSIFHSLSTVYRTDQATFGEAFITVNTKTGIITDISTTLPPNNVHTIIELGSNLLLPGAIDLYAGATQEQESDNWSGVSTAEHSRIETVTKICARSGITTVVETPLLQLFPDTIPSTPAKLKDKWQLINNPAICKTIDYGLLASVEDVNDVSQLAASGHCLGLMVVVGSPIGPLKRSPRSVESLKILKIAKEASKYSTTTMKGALFIKAEHYSARQLRLASPLRMHDVQERRRTDLSIDHPAYMLGLKMNPELSSSFDINRSDEFERDMKRHEQRTRAASALPGQLYVGSDTTSAPSSVARKERRISPKSIHTNNNRSTNDLQHQEKKHSDDAVNIKKSSSFSGKGGLTGLWQLTMSGTTPTDSETRNHNVLRVRSPTVKTIGGLRNHSFSAFHTSPKSSNSSFSSSKNNTFISALLSEELKSYGHGTQTNETRSGSNTNHNNHNNHNNHINHTNHNINHINPNNSAPRPLNTKSLSGTSSSSSSSGGSISNSNISPRSNTPKSPLQFGTSNDVELHTSITGHQGSGSRTSWSSDNNGAKRSTSTGSNSSLGSDCDSRASFELLVQHSKEKSLQVRSIALNKKISNRNVDLVVRSSSRSFQGTTSTATASVSAIVDPRASSPISLPMAIPGTLGSTLGTGSNSTNDFVEMARKQREDMWGEMVAPEPDEFPISPPKLKRMQGSKMPSLLERRRKRMEKLQKEREAATTTSSSESSQHNSGSGSGSGSGSSESHSMNSRLETRIRTENTPPIVGSFGEAPGFIVAPLQVFKVPDTLTTTAISANYTIYMSQRPESGKSIQSEGAAREWSTVVDISITPPSFKPVSLPSPRSPISKTPKHVIF